MDRTRNCDVRITDESLSLLIGLSSALSDRGRGKEKTRPSVRPSPFFNTSVRHACLSLINVMLEMPFIVVFTVSSSVQSIPQVHPHSTMRAAWSAINILLCVLNLRLLRLKLLLCVTGQRWLTHHMLWTSTRWQGLLILRKTVRGGFWDIDARWAVTATSAS